MAAPRIGIKRKLKKHFKVYNINEYNTSKMCYKTEKKTENLYIKNYKKTEGDKKEKEQIKLHAVLTYKMENNRTGCINRDKNSCSNMIKIVNEWITNKKRPLYLSIPIIDINPSWSKNVKSYHCCLGAMEADKHVFYTSTKNLCTRYN